MNEKLREKLAEWAGFQWLEATDGNYHWFDANGDIVSPTDEDGNVIWDMNACFKHLVPKFQEMCASRSDYEGLETCDNDIHIFLRLCEGGGWTTKGWMGSIEGFRTLSGVEGAETAALAFCLAIEKLIDGEK